MPDEYTEDAAMGPLARVFAIFHSPVRVYADIERGIPWWEPWAAVSLLNMVIAYVVIPINARLFSLNPHGLSPEELSRGMETMQKFYMKYLGVITAPLSVLFGALVFSGVSYVVVSVLSDRPDFKKHFTIYLYCSVVVSVGVLVSNLIVRWHGVENIRNVGDAVAPLGPAALFSPDAKIWFAFASTLDV
ncbi:MAG: YIP1 family protein, partial [bacterium]